MGGKFPPVAKPARKSAGSLLPLDGVECAIDEVVGYDSSWPGGIIERTEGLGESGGGRKAVDD